MVGSTTIETGVLAGMITPIGRAKLALERVSCAAELVKRHDAVDEDDPRGASGDVSREEADSVGAHTNG